MKTRGSPPSPRVLGLPASRQAGQPDVHPAPPPPASRMSIPAITHCVMPAHPVDPDIRAWLALRASHRLSPVLLFLQAITAYPVPAGRTLRRCGPSKEATTFCRDGLCRQSRPCRRQQAGQVWQGLPVGLVSEFYSYSSTCQPSNSFPLYPSTRQTGTRFCRFAGSSRITNYHR